jgi:hypothetical protein
MRVDHRGFEIFVAEAFLNGPDINSISLREKSMSDCGDNRCNRMKTKHIAQLLWLKKYTDIVIASQ